MNLKFTKMQATGNDYIFVNLFDADDFKIFNETNWSQIAIRLSDRHFGIGSDGLILICPSDIADCRMRMFNIICVETKSGIRTLYLDIEDEMYVKSVCVDMGVPVLSSSLEIGFFFVTPVSLGNPHAVCFVPNSPSEYPVEKWGPFLECHPQLGERSNVEFVQIVSHNKICLRIWERGSKETLSCGTGACAAAVCAIQQKGMENKVLAEVPGGTLTISWNGNGEAVFLSGPAEFICDAFAAN